MPNLDRFSHPLRYESDFTTRWYEPDVITLEEIEQDAHEAIKALLDDEEDITLDNVLLYMETPSVKLTEAHRRHVQDLIEDAVYELKSAKHAYSVKT